MAHDSMQLKGKFMPGKDPVTVRDKKNLFGVRVTLAKKKSYDVHVTLIEETLARLYGRGSEAHNIVQMVMAARKTWKLL